MALVDALDALGLLKLCDVQLDKLQYDSYPSLRQIKDELPAKGERPDSRKLVGDMK